MTNSSNILVVTTHSIEGIKIKKYLKPVSAHIVAGTNLFNDFLGGLTDVFGGRSDSYQKQLTSLYVEAIERIKNSANEIGGNCVVGLNIDMDEISGKGKSMFMLTAVGTAVIIEKDEKLNSLLFDEKLEYVDVDKINNLKEKRNIIEKITNQKLTYYDDAIWDTIITNQIEEVFPFLLKSHTDVIESFQNELIFNNPFNRNFINYLNSLEERKKINLIYNQIETNENIRIIPYLLKIITLLNLFDADKILILLKNSDFEKQKIGLRLTTSDKSYYNKEDINNFKKIKSYVLDNFKERGNLSTKKQILSSKEKKVWNCECGHNSNELNDYCGSCNKDIFGFKRTEIKPKEVIKHLDEKIELINEYIKQ